MRRLLVISSIAYGLFGCSQTDNPTSAVSASSSTSSAVAARGTSDTYIPIVVVGYFDQNFGGARRYFYMDENDLRRQGANDVFSSIKVYKGPQYDAYKAANGGAEPSVSFCSDINLGGPCNRFTVGNYATLPHNDYYSSVVFNLDAQLAETVTPFTLPTETFPVELIVRMFSDINYGGIYVDLLGTQNSEHRAISNYTNTFKNDFFSSVQVLKGPNWNYSKIYFYEDKNFGGNYAYTECTDGICHNNPDIGWWSDRISSSQSPLVF